MKSGASWHDIATGLSSLHPMNLLESIAQRSECGIARVISTDSATIWIVNNPELIDAISVKRRHEFDRGGWLYAHLEGGNHGVLKDGPFTQNGPNHDILRDICNPFFTPEAMKSAAEFVAVHLENSLLDWRSDEVSLRPVFEEASLAILTHHLFGGHIDPALTSKIAALAPVYFNKMAWQLVLGRAPKKLGALFGYEAAGAEFGAVLDEIIATALDHPTLFNETLLGKLLAAFDIATPEGRQLVKGTLGTFYLAGFDSTAVVLAKACIELSQDQSTQSRLQAEVLATFGKGPILPSKLSELPLLSAYWKLMLHKHTAFRIIFRNVVEDCELGGEKLRANDQLLLAVHGMHTDPRYGKASALTLEDFQPPMEAELRKAHMPFGVGARKCIGAPLARYQGEITLATILQQFTLTGRPVPHLGNLQAISMTSRLRDSRVTIERLF